MIVLTGWALESSNERPEMQNIGQSEPIDMIYFLIEAKSISLLEEEQPGGEHSKAKGYNSHSFVIPQRYR